MRVVAGVVLALDQHGLTAADDHCMWEEDTSLLVEDRRFGWGCWNRGPRWRLVDIDEDVGDAVALADL